MSRERKNSGLLFSSVGASTPGVELFAVNVLRQCWAWGWVMPLGAEPLPMGVCVDPGTQAAASRCARLTVAVSHPCYL